MLTKLFVTVDNYLLAKRFGAERNALTGEWFVHGEVPAELINLTVPPSARTKDPDRAPPCPVCGALAVKRFRKSDKHPFWGCPMFHSRDCPGVVDYEDHLGRLSSDAMSIAGALASTAKVDTSSPTAAPIKPESSDALKQAIHEIAALAEVQLEARKINEWFARRMSSLANKTPLEEMRNLAGCERVRHLLAHIHD